MLKFTFFTFAFTVLNIVSSCILYTVLNQQIDIVL